MSAATAMIGVAASTTDLSIAGEFFELFKTAWEPVVPGRHYHVVLCSDQEAEHVDARVLVLFGTKHVTDTTPLPLSKGLGPVDVAANGDRFPIYGAVTQFQACRVERTLAADDRPIVYRTTSGDQTVWRIGYDLFAEIRQLLIDGQPASYAEIPTLEHHIDVLRRVLIDSCVPFVEIPPRPAGFDFICCLTHDLDFFGIRRHVFDRTLAGFIVRASVGTLTDLIRGRRPLSEALRNWAALGALPGVLLGFAQDFWRPFDDYSTADQGLPNTFFLVPVKGKPGVSPDRQVHAARAVAYQISDIKDEILNAAAQGSELAIHGIDAWEDAEAGRQEISQLTSVTGQERPGVRMHWLYFDERSPRQLECAGFAYDSTYGYNDAIGYRPGTSQVFCIPGTELMELPLSIMDSALFFNGRMALPRDEARRRCKAILKNAGRFGGTVVVNWHDRSLSPERQWRQPYEELLGDLREGNSVWFATASQAVEWYRWRRSISFRAEESGSVTVRAASHEARLPSFRVQVHRPTQSGRDSVTEHAYDGCAEMTFQL